MCGITGFYALEKNAIPYLTKVEQSLNKLSRRGPDNKRFTNDGKVALGHARLCVIDTSEKASQPMSDHSGRYTIIFNGEIFNYLQLSERYLGAVWAETGGPRSRSDTEVLLYLLIHYGVSCLEWLSGFFAFALYDRESGELLLARDRYGKKPLLYYEGNGYLAFASEMKALMEWEIPKQLNTESLYHYLQLNYVPPAQSMLRGVQKLKPGHYLKAGPDSIHSQCYYELSLKPERYQQYTYHEAEDRLVQLMEQAVQERLIADVPLGAFLSGGIDSSVIVALASRHTDRLNTFSVGYRDNKFFDETKYAELVAKKYQTNHTVFSLANQDFLEHLHDLLDYLDEPYADSSAIPMYILCNRTRRHVTVALSGDGGDEVFSGYNKHMAERKMRRTSLLNTLVGAGGPIWNALPQSRNNKFANLARQLSKFAAGTKLSIKDRYWNWASITDVQTAEGLLHPKLRAGLNRQVAERDKTGYLRHLDSEDFNAVLAADMELVLPGDMLVKVDQMSMANSLEVRSPFLDYRVVEFAFGLPARYKINNSQKKRIVQDAFRSLLPEELYNRPKHGFEIPMLDWLRRELWPMIDEDLLQRNFVAQQGIFDVQAVEELKKRLRSNNPGNSHATIWALLVFQHWWKRYYR